MGLIHGGWLVAKTLKQEGVEVVFTLSGGHIAAIYDGCLREGIRVVDTRHEQAAVHAAEGWAKAAPVFLEMPMDILNIFADTHPLFAPGEPSYYRPAGRTMPDPLDVAKAAAILEQSQRPVIMAGTAVWWCDASKQLRLLAERIQAPVFLNGAGRGCLPPDHPLFFSAARRRALENADTILAIGTRLDFRLNHGQP